MRTWLATAALLSRRMAMKISAVVALFTVSAAAAFAQPEAGGEAALKLPDLSQVSFFNGAIDGHKLLLIGILFCVFGLGFGMVDFHAAEEPAGASVDARDFGTHLRDLQDVSGNAGQIHLVAVGIHRRHYRGLFWLAVAGAGKVSGADASDHPRLQSGRNRGQLWRGVVRHSRQHVREFADGVRLPARQAVSGLPDPA